ncbi:hypothetical protein PV325_004200 [Microctonus aethiopoides]|nr:hypothetical protein PV325_004200 [Microctonus aethiopoides]KAK0092106.1 hypothetical protein PV326_002200 [Microctonus aethiopoides]
MSVWDLCAGFDGRTHRGKFLKSYGGVGRNVAAALVALGANGTRFVTAVGDDRAGKYIIESLQDAGETVEKLPNKMTARYTGIIDRNGECHLGIGEMDIFESIDANLIRNNQSIIEQTQIIILDGNPPVETMREVIDIAYNRLLPVDVSKIHY